MQVEVVSSYAALSERAATLVADLIRQRPDAVLALPTGNTPVGLYAALARSGLSFARVRTFNLDEYLGLPRSHPHSLGTWMQQHLFSRVDLDPGHIYIFDGTAADPVAESARYEAAIAAAGGLDLAVLGIGTNGHIGFNEPGSPFAARTRPVTLAESSRAAQAGSFGSPAAVPPTALTMGIGTLLEARRILLLAAGEDKAAIIRRLLTEPPGEALPASALHGHPDCTLLLDAAAARWAPPMT